MNVANFLQALYGGYRETEGQTIEMRVLPPKWLKSASKMLYRHWYPLSEMGYTALAADSARFQARGDVYISFLPRLGEQGDMASVMQARWLFCGVDGEAQGVEGAIDLLKSVVRWGKLPTPNILVNSGHGLHVYWQLPDVFDLSAGDNREEYNGLLRRIGLAIGGALPDAHADVARCNQMPRLPGSINHKTQGAPVRVALQRFVLDGDLWPLKLWQQKLPQERTQASRETPQYAKMPVGEIPSFIRHYAMTPVPHGERNEAFVKLVCKARAAGFDERALQILGEQFCATNPGYKRSEMLSNVKWAVRRFAPSSASNSPNRRFSQ